eukprot:scaffold185176_cov32-Tisochrysis_lutea.AAC.1
MEPRIGGRRARRGTKGTKGAGRGEGQRRRERGRGERQEEERREEDCGGVGGARALADESEERKGRNRPERVREGWGVRRTRTTFLFLSPHLLVSECPKEFCSIDIHNRTGGWLFA